MFSKKKKKEPSINKEVQLERKKEMEILKQLSTKERIEKLKLKILLSSGTSIEDVDEDKLTECAKNLSLEDNLKTSYLNKDFQAVKEMFGNIPEETTKKQKSKLFESSQEPTSQQKLSSQGINNQETLVDLEEIEKEEKSSQFKIRDKIKIKLIISEISHSKKDKRLRSLLSPFITALGVGPQFGIFHSALIIGPWYLEWTNRSFIVPRKCYSNAALLAIDVDHEIAKRDCDVVIDKIAEVIVRWNVLYTYDKTTKNCQHFVEDLLEELGIDNNLAFKGAMGQFLKSMRKYGSYKLGYSPPSKLLEKMLEKNKKKEFKTHKELDDYVNKIIAVCPTFQESFPHDYQLLKSFDRAFWLRHYRHSDKEEFKECNCPFDDPKKTKTFPKSNDW